MDKPLNLIELGMWFLGLCIAAGPAKTLLVLGAAALMLMAWAKRSTLYAILGLFGIAVLVVGMFYG